MRTLLILPLALPLLCLLGCGENEKTEEKTVSDIHPSPTPTPSPTPEVHSVCENPALVGNWISGRSSLNFSKDCTVMAQDEKLSWSIETKDNIDYLNFAADSAEVDLCSYQIKSSGTLTSPISILLDLICAKSGTLTYTKKD